MGPTHPTLNCSTSFFHTAFGIVETPTRGRITELCKLLYAAFASALSGTNPTVLEQQSSNALMACCHVLVTLPDMPTAWETSVRSHQLMVVIIGI
jgi:hypothetical protein